MKFGVASKRLVAKEKRDGLNRLLFFGGFGYRCVVSGLLSEVTSLTVTTFGISWATASVASQVRVITAAIDVPMEAISDSMTAVSAADAIAVRYGGNAVISPCQTCSTASRITPPHSSEFSMLSFSFSASPREDFCSVVVTIAIAIGTMKHAIFINLQ
jgi:hypothetical protein